MNLELFEKYAESLYSNASSKETHENMVKLISSLSDNQLNNYAETLKITKNPFAQLWILSQLKEFIISYLNLLDARQVLELSNLIVSNLCRSFYSYHVQKFNIFLCKRFVGSGVWDFNCARLVDV